MKKRAAILTIATGLIIAAAGAGVFILNQNINGAAHTDTTVILAETLPSHIRIEGEARTGKNYASFTVKDGTLSLNDTQHLDEVVLRLIDEQDSAFYDLVIGKKLSMAGFEPNTHVTLHAPDKVVYQDIPMDWNGRITLDIPDTRPLWLSFSQNDESYRIGIMTETGGEA